ncbi:unnamed protein product, partial [Ectocarpus sp. 12 AP-2014]
AIVAVRVKLVAQSALQKVSVNGLTFCATHPSHQCHLRYALFFSQSVVDGIHPRHHAQIHAHSPPTSLFRASMAFVCLPAPFRTAARFVGALLYRHTGGA